MKEITATTTEIQKVRDCFKTLYTNKLDYLKATDKFLETQNFPRMTWE